MLSVVGIAGANPDAEGAGANPDAEGAGAQPAGGVFGG